ncbi:RNA exonuclease 1 homolog isoform X2 [Thrips palmi]|uniref:RNA exonuclease 1 homolog isoform X2 n=1 Tax=Thrips palmi TaxID=161013 RepID=A0A6P9A0Z9_THRPL|nr:RNA exonuclease 1 homolog isoform X2 [Thrips palmi]
MCTRLISTRNLTGKPEKKEKKVDHHQAAKPAASKKKQEKWASRDSKAFTHPWMLTSLKGHTGEVLDMDFSGNSKFLATCADDLEVASTEDGSPGDRSGNSSSSEGNKENKRPPDSGGGGTPRAAARSRRQKKNASPGKKNKAKGKRASNGTSDGSSKQAQSIPLRQRAKLKLTDNELAQFFLHYVLSPDQLLGLSFPVESTLYPGRAIIFKTPSNRPSQPVVHQPTQQSHLFDVNAQEFVPKFTSPFLYPSPSKVPQASELSENIYVSSSLVGNGASWKDGSSDSDSSKSEDFVKLKDEPKVTPSPVKSKAQEELSRGSDEKWCVRCGRGFFVSNDGEYLTQEKCLYHWGKLQVSSIGVADYSCCKGRSNTKGCTTGKLHVWKGINDGINGPLDGFVRTRSRKTIPPDGNYGIYALDCEMCFTTNGLELIKVTVVATDGRLVYDSLVKPEHYIIDYNTRFSGITAKDLNKKGATKSLKDVQNDLMGFINADTILIGHGLENDLRALRIIHGTVIDTSVVFPHYYGLPYRRSLKSLANCLLKRDIQSDSSGHDSYEDARACIELMLWRIRKEFRSVLDGQSYYS